MKLATRLPFALGLLAASTFSQAYNLSTPDGAEVAQQPVAITVDDDLRQQIMQLKEESIKLNKAISKTPAMIESGASSPNQAEPKAKDRLPMVHFESRTISMTSSLKSMANEMTMLSRHITHTEGAPYKLYVLTLVASRNYAWQYMGEFDNRKDCSTAGLVLSKTDSSKYSGYDRWAARLEGNPYACL